jgi:hypothetical protein
METEVEALQPRYPSFWRHITIAMQRTSKMGEAKTTQAAAA